MNATKFAPGGIPQPIPPNDDDKESKKYAALCTCSRRVHR